MYKMSNLKLIAKFMYIIFCFIFSVLLPFVYLSDLNFLVEIKFEMIYFMFGCSNKVNVDFSTNAKKYLSSF